MYVSKGIMLDSIHKKHNYTPKALQNLNLPEQARIRKLKQINQRSFSSTGRLNHAPSSLGGSRLTNSRISIDEPTTSKKQSQEEPSNIFQGMPQKSQFVNIYSKYFKVDWSTKFQDLYGKKLYHELAMITMERSATIRRLFQDFVNIHWQRTQEQTRKTVCGSLLKQFNDLVLDSQKILKDALVKIPQKKVLDQEEELFSLFKTLLTMNDPEKCISFEKDRELNSFYYGVYSERKYDLNLHKTTKIRPMFEVLQACEGYFKKYKREMHRLQQHLRNSEVVKQKLEQLLNKKTNFVPIQIDYLKIKSIKQQHKEQIMGEINETVVKWHRERIQEGLDRENNLYTRKEDLQQSLLNAEQQIQELKVKINSLINEKPRMIDACTQLNLLPAKKIDGQEISISGKSFLQEFLSGFVSPFTFHKECASGLINLIMLDKLLWDFQCVRKRAEITPMKIYLFQWFVAKAGSRRVAQILCKNFVSSVKQLKRKSKRFHLFAKIAGLSKPRNKKIQQDLDLFFHQTNYAWYLFAKTAFMYRRKLTDGISGFPLIAPISNEDLSRLPARKAYDLIQTIFRDEGMESLISSQLSNKFDLYAINQISKFKMWDNKFVKEPTQEIHILKDINFQIVAGFILEYISDTHLKQTQKVLRAIDLRQKQKGTLLIYEEFEQIFRKGYREKKHIVQIHFSKICLRSMKDVLSYQNYQEFAKGLLEDDSKVRNMFVGLDALRVLTNSEKAQADAAKKKVNPNTYQFFRERFHHQFYDFYHSTVVIQQIYKAMKPRLMKMIEEDKQIARQIEKQVKGIVSQQQQQGETVIDFQKVKQSKDQPPPQPQPQAQAQPPIKYPQQKQEEVNKQDQPLQEQPIQPTKELKLDQQTLKKRAKEIGVNIQFDEQGRPNISLLRLKHEEFRLIHQKIPSFNKHFITVDQILVNPLRRQEFYEVTEHCWKVLRELLMLVAQRLER